MKSAVVLFHQGWTDILNCLPLVKHYCSNYEKVILYVRKDSEYFLDLFNRQIENLHIEFVDKNLLNQNSFINKIKELHKTSHFLFHGEQDRLREDEYRSTFFSDPSRHFALRFYDCYGLNRSHLNSNFCFTREEDLEDEIYKNFTQQYGKDYILTHSTREREINLKTNLPVVDLGGMNINPFVYLKVLEGAKEIHVVDSFWAIFCFLIEEGQSLFCVKERPIYLYCLNRPGGLLPNDKVVSKYKNWRIVCN